MSLATLLILYNKWNSSKKKLLLDFAQDGAFWVDNQNHLEATEALNLVYFARLVDTAVALTALHNLSLSL